MTTNSSRQKGIALLLLVVVLAMAAISYFISAVSFGDITRHQQSATSKALQQAKRALIAYAVTYGDTGPHYPGEFGFLPCPDYNNGLNEGFEDDGNCGSLYTSKLGYLPWKTLGVPALKDASGSCLLYAVSGDYKNRKASFGPDKAFMLNEDSNGSFQVIDKSGTVTQGQVPEDRVVAIVFAPGEPLSGQSRSVNQAGSMCGEDYANYSAYLDSVNLDPSGVVDNSDVVNAASQIDKFIHATEQSVRKRNYNDRFVTITRDEIWQAIVARTDYIQNMADLTEALAICISDYATVNSYKRLPWPVQMNLADYQQNAMYDDNDDASLGYAGRFPFIVDSSNSDMGVTGSPELFSVAACNAISVSSGKTVDLQTPNTEYRKLWDNWKDHFFYVVSKDYAPATSNATCGADCITVDSITRAAMVVFSGSRMPDQIRNGPLVAGDIDTKSDIGNYLENGNETNFPDSGGNGAYTDAGLPASNDIIFCISATPTPVATSC